jgi:hypothetical protein
MRLFVAAVGIALAGGAHDTFGKRRFCRAKQKPSRGKT